MSQKKQNSLSRGKHRMNKMKSKEKFIPEYISRKDFFSKYVSTGVWLKIDNFVYELSNIAGAVWEEFLSDKKNLTEMELHTQLSTKEIVKICIPICYAELNKCYMCGQQCQYRYFEDGHQAFRENIFKQGGYKNIKEFPEELHQQTIGDFFAVEFGNRLSYEFEMALNKMGYLSDDEIHNFASDFFWAVAIFISDCFRCPHLCPANPEAKAIF